MKKMIIMGLLLAMLVYGFIVFVTWPDVTIPIESASVIPQSKTSIGIYYTDTVAYMDVETVSITMTCKLLPGGNLPPVETKVFTWTVPCETSFVPDMVAVEPISLTWTVPLIAGAWYEEWCKTEADGVFGWVPGGSQQDNYYMVNRWPAGFFCYLPAVMK